MSKQEEWEKAIAAYRQGYLDLVRLAVVLLDGDQDLLRLKETVDGLTENQCKHMLTTAVAFAAQEHIEMRRRSSSN